MRKESNTYFYACKNRKMPLSSLRKKFLTYFSVQKKVSKPHGETASRSVANRVLLLQRKRALRQSRRF